MVKNIVTIGGGKGQSELLSGLKSYEYNLGAIVAMTDNGGSSGEMREEHGILPPGDVRRCIAALAADPELEAKWNARAEDNTAHGNELLRDLFLEHGTEEGIRIAHEQYNVQGTVAPVTTANVDITAVLTDGTIVEGEEEIEHLPLGSNTRIMQLGVSGLAHISDSAAGVIANADLIVLSMGSLYASLISNLVIDGVAAAIRDAGVPVVLVCNRTNGEDTIGYTQLDYLESVQQYLGEGVLTHMIVDNGDTPYPPDSLVVAQSELPEHVIVIAQDLAAENRIAISGEKVAKEIDTLCKSL